MFAVIRQRAASSSSIVVAFLAAVLAGSAGAQAPASVTLIRNANVFDGVRMLGVRDVLVSGGSIVRIAPSVFAPAGATIVDGTGKTLLPGLIDAHAHVFGDALQQALVFGVTTELDMFTMTSEASRLRAEQKAGKAASRADIFSAGTLATAPRGHGTEYGFPIPTIASPDSAQAWVDGRIAEGSDYIKIVFDDGSAYGMNTPTISSATLAALISAAHRRGKLAVVHIGSAEGARVALEAGANGLVHLFTDRAPSTDLGKLAARHKAFIIPTLTVLTSVTGKSGAGDLSDDPSFKDYLSQQGKGTIKGAFPVRSTSPPRSLLPARATIRQLLTAGVTILAGSDAPNPGTAHGIALHREIELLAQAGLSNVQALAAATNAPAVAFSLRDRGRIATGMRADLVLVRGNPAVDITATRRIEGVWKGGERFDRTAYAASLVPASVASAAVATPRGGGSISDFEDGTSNASFGSGWVVSTDTFAGGTSSADMKVSDGGANGTKKSLAVAGTIVGPLPYAWGGVMLMTGPQPMQPADLSAAKSLHFWAKGDGKTYKIMLFSQSKGMQPLMQDFVASTEWKEYDFPFATFDGVKGNDIIGFAFTGGPTPGAFSMQIDEVSLR